MEAQTGTGRAEDSGVYEYGGKKCGACGFDVGLWLAVVSGTGSGCKRAQEIPGPSGSGPGLVII